MKFKPHIRLHLWNFYFTPKLVPTLLFLLLLPLLIKLGIWQLHRGAYKQRIIDNFNARGQEAPLSFNKVSSMDPQTIEYYRVILKGTYENRYLFLLDNQIQNHQVGYDVIVPFVVKGEPSKVVLVNRGWVPHGMDRANLPVIKPVFGEQEIRGTIRIPAAKPFLLSHQAGSLAWPRVIEAIELDKIGKSIPMLMPFVVLLAPDQSHGFVRAWAPVQVSPQKHYAYAFQWFALALTLVIIYLASNIRRGRQDE
jgi:surfeit locus 1 family protein